MKSVDIAILGGGIASVYSAFLLSKRFPNSNIIIIEACNKLGGLLRSESINCFTFDIGGSHVIFSENIRILRTILSFLKGGWLSHKRKTYIRIDNLYIPYPFENGIFILPSQKRAEILISFIEALIERSKDLEWRPKNLKEWIYGFFGKSIADLYLIPYNEKIWKRELNEIDSDWVYIPGRLPIPDWRDVVRSAIGISTQGYYEQLTFYYPRRGGIQALLQAILNKINRRKVKVLTNFRVKEIRKCKNSWIINNRIRTKKIVSTIPLRELVMTMDAPSHVIKASNQLDYNQVLIVGIALNDKAPNEHWIYVPNKSIIFHRYAWISNYSPENAPPGRSSLIAEITVPPNVQVDEQFKHKVLHKVIDGLMNLDVISNDRKIIFAKVWHHQYGYPVYRLRHSKYRDEVLSWLKEQGVISIGRWGSWHYWNIDKIINSINVELFKWFSKL